MISRRNFLQTALVAGVLAGVAPWGPAFARVAGPDPVPAIDIQRSRLETGSPSATAQGTAILRAAHQLLDKPLILDDPMALRPASGRPRGTVAYLLQTRHPGRRIASPGI